MSANSEEIIQLIGDEFDGLLRLVTSSETDEVPTSYEMEVSLLSALLAFGRRLYGLYLATQSARFHQASAADCDGRVLPYHSERPRVYQSVFGPVAFDRSYYYSDGHGWFALDAALNLPEKGPSDLLRQWQERLATSEAYQSVGDILSHILGLSASTRAIAEAVCDDGALVEEYYAQSAPEPASTPSATILVAQADGKGVPMVLEPSTEPPVRLGKGQKTGRKKEAIVTAVYTQEPAPRTPEAVVRSLFDHDKEGLPARSRPCNKWQWATLAGKEAALRFASDEVARQDGPHIKDRVALTDGAEVLQEKVRAQFPGFELVLDFIHADEYLWDAGNALLGETAPERTGWVRERTLQLLRGQTEAVIADLRTTAEQEGVKPFARQVLRKVANYYERNAPYMRYHKYLEAGWPIATGVIEGACRHVVKDRCEQSGMRWTQPGAENLLHLRCLHQNGDWDDFHQFRRDKRHKDVYGYQGQPTGQVPDMLIFRTQQNNKLQCAV